MQRPPFPSVKNGIRVFFMSFLMLDARVARNSSLGSEASRLLLKKMNIWKG